MTLTSIRAIAAAVQQPPLGPWVHRDQPRAVVQTESLAQDMVEDGAHAGVHQQLSERLPRVA